MAFLLFLEALLQLLHDLFPAAQRFDLRFLLLGQEFLGQCLQPFLGNVGELAITDQFQALEHMTENDVELVEIALVLDQRGAGEKVEVLDPAIDDIGIHRFEHGQIFAQADGNVGFFQFMKEVDEHGRFQIPEWRLGAV